MKPIAGNVLFTISLIALMIFGLILMILVTTGSFSYDGTSKTGYVANGSGLLKFSSDEELVKAFGNSAYWGGSLYGEGAVSGRLTTSSTTAGLPNSYTAIVNPYSATASFGGGYSTTNVQVTGVDEADMVKTDGDYIYVATKNKLLILKAYSATATEIVFQTTYDDFTPKELFISGDRLLVLGSSSPGNTRYINFSSMQDINSWPHSGMASARLYDLSSRGAPQLIKSFDLEGGYDTSRMIGDYAYVIVNSYRYTYLREKISASMLVPLYREGSGQFEPIGEATDIYYLPPVDSLNFVTICSINMTDGSIEKETIAGSGCQVYASRENLYLTRSTYLNNSVNTIIIKLQLAGGKILDAGTGTVPGQVLNQFSMDESDGYFRIATTTGNMWDSRNPSTSNIYILDHAMNTVGSLQGLAPGEQIYSARFMGSRCYLVTFKKIDPLFVIDLSDPGKPGVLGKLKIPGYSDYLHPYDETHLIGIGKDAVDAGDGGTSGSQNFAWFQGVKMAMFDVTDVEHPKELHKVVIGDRGSDSPVLYDHRAFLLDRNNGLLVLPVTVAEIKEPKTSDYQYGEPVFKGAYVYNVSLADGFVLRGNVTHYKPGDDVKSGSWCDYSTGIIYLDHPIQRSLYIGDVLYTMSRSRLQLNNITTLEELKAVEL